MMGKKICTLTFDYECTRPIPKEKYKEGTYDTEYSATVCKKDGKNGGRRNGYGLIATRVGISGSTEAKHRCRILEDTLKVDEKVEE